MTRRLSSFLVCLLVPLLLAWAPGVTAAEEPPARAQGGYDRLADLLEDEAARSALVEQLRRLGEEEAAGALETPGEPVSIAGRIAGFTRTVAEGVATEAGDAIRSVGEAWTRLIEAAPGELVRDLGEFALLIVATLAIFRLLGAAVGAAFRALDRFAGKPGTHAVTLVRRMSSIVAAGVLDAAVVALAWLCGYGIALAALGSSGGIGVLESLFLNAFLLVELVRSALRVIFAKRGEHLRCVPLSGEEAAYWYAWISRMVFFLGYGLMLVVPAINHYLAPGLGRAIAILIMLSALLKMAVIVLQNRNRVREALESLALRMQSPFGRISISMGARVWHVVAIAYLAAILVTSILYPEQALPYMLAATLQTLITVAIGIALAAFLTQVILRRIQLKDDLRSRFPLLEARLNAYVPTALKIARFAILAVVIAFIVDAWSPFDLGEWVVSDAGAMLIGRAVSVALILALALAVWLVVASWIEFRLNPVTGDGEPNPRARTLLTIFRNAVAIALVVLTSMVVLAEIGINIAPLLAGAGVLGLAIGFGAQKLVQDVITGVFIQLENAINVGDVVTAGGTTGVVERLTIRSLGLRDLAGVYHLIPFSAVDRVSNFNREFGYHVGEYGVAYREDTDEVVEHLKAAFAELLEDPEIRPNILAEELEVHGVTALADSSVNVRVRIKTVPGTQFGIGRAYNRLVKRHFDAAGIEIPFPHMTVYFGEDKQGKAPPAHLRLTADPGAPAPELPTAPQTGSSA